VIQAPATQLNWRWVLVGKYGTWWTQDVYTRDFSGRWTCKPTQKAAGRWNTNRGGDYFAIGVGGAVTGKGADMLIIDDPHSEQEAALAATNPEIYDKVYRVVYIRTKATSATGWSHCDCDDALGAERFNGSSAESRRTKRR
jgi:hypothetical protein